MHTALYLIHPSIAGCVFVLLRAVTDRLQALLLLRMQASDDQGVNSAKGGSRNPGDSRSGAVDIDADILLRSSPQVWIWLSNLNLRAKAAECRTSAAAAMYHAYPFQCV